MNRLTRLVSIGFRFTFNFYVIVILLFDNVDGNRPIQANKLCPTERFSIVHVEKHLFSRTLDVWEVFDSRQITDERYVPAMAC